jgi:signal transduction histidine kinase
VERFDSWHQRPDGRHIAVSMTMSPLRDRDGTVTGLATSVEDVTERIRLDAELEDARRSLAEQNEALRRSNRDLQQFAYIASHDLSEPLRVMTGYVQLLETRYADAFDDKGRRWIAHVVEGRPGCGS